jgi:hypothetical protein
MKMKDILPEDEAKNENEKENGECLLCLTHDLAQDKIDVGLVCPYCTAKHHYDITDEDYVVVGMTNSYSPEDKIEKFITIKCYECGEYFSLFPEKINYNANHDVYYTGGKNYLNDGDENQIFLEAQKAIEKSLKQWKDRYEKGEKLDEFYPALWIKRNITSAIAKYLYEKGLKK